MTMLYNLTFHLHAVPRGQPTSFVASAPNELGTAHRISVTTIIAQERDDLAVILRLYYYAQPVRLYHGDDVVFHAIQHDGSRWDFPARGRRDVTVDRPCRFCVKYQVRALVRGVLVIKQRYVLQSECRQR